jgi:glycopeptide antibiotics resistance protein
VSYLLGVCGVLLLQVGFSFAIISATAGGGSFVGLGAMLLAVLGVPLTALINFLLIRSNRKNPATPYVLRLALVSLALPAAQLALMILVSVLRL